MVVRDYKNDEMTDRVTSFELNEEGRLDHAKFLFNKQKDRGIHLGEFEDDLWKLTDQYDKGKIDFGKVEGVPLDLSRTEYITCLKMLFVGEIDTRQFKGVIEKFRKIIAWGNETNGFRNKLNVNLREPERIMLLKLFQQFDIDEQEILQENYDVGKNRDYNKRDLAPVFWTYYVFDFEIKKFWEEASDEEKLIYAPLYFYWRIACTVPVRPGAFCLLEKDCVVLEADSYYYLKLPLSGIKGSGKIVTNVKSLDCPIRIYRLDATLANEILAFKNLIHPDNDEENVKYLFTNKYMNELRGKRYGKDFKKEHLEKLLHMFFSEILSKKNYEIKDIGCDEVISFAEKKWLTKWRLGDLRHLVMIDMVLRGISPTVIVKLAGQDSLASACHYYTNSSNMSRCRLEFMISQQKKDYFAENLKEDLAAKELPKGVPMYGGLCLYNEAPEAKVQYCLKYDLCMEGCPFFQHEEKSKEKYQDLVEEKISKKMEEFVYWSDKGREEKAMKALREAQDGIAELGGLMNG